MKRGQRLGWLLFGNTVGSIAGSLLTTYVFFSIFGSIVTFKIMLALFGLLIMAICLTNKRWLWTVPFFSFVLFLLPPQAISVSSDAVFEEEDSYGLLSYVEKPGNQKVIFQNLYPLNSPTSNRDLLDVEKNMAVLASLFAGDSRKALIVGHGYGITSSTLNQMERLEKIETVEILPLVLKLREILLPLISSQNVGKLHFTQGDGRSFIESGKERWDLIFILVENVYGNMSTILMSKQFYQAVQPRLSEGGILIELFWGSPADVGAQVATLQAAFPHVLLLPGYQGDGAFALASKSPLFNWDRPALQERMQELQKFFPLKLQDRWINSLEELKELSEKSAQMRNVFLKEAQTAPQIEDHRPLLEMKRGSFFDLFKFFPSSYLD